MQQQRFPQLISCSALLSILQVSCVLCRWAVRAFNACSPSEFKFLTSCVVNSKEDWVITVQITKHFLWVLINTSWPFMEQEISDNNNNQKPDFGVEKQTWRGAILIQKWDRPTSNLEFWVTDRSGIFWLCGNIRIWLFLLPCAEAQEHYNLIPQLSPGAKIDPFYHGAQFYFSSKCTILTTKWQGTEAFKPLVTSFSLKVQVHNFLTERFLKFLKLCSIAQLGEQVYKTL